MSALAPTVQAWFTEHLLTHDAARRKSPVVLSGIPRLVDG